MPLRLAALALSALLLAPSAPAPQVPAPSQVPLTVRAEINEFSARLRSYVDFCDRYARPEYQVDCLSERMTFAASTLGNYGWEREVKAALKASARSLNAVTTKYRAPDAPPVRIQNPATPITPTRPIRPVAPENVTRAAAAAEGVFQNAELTLLRSADTSPENALAFAQVAEVLGTAKVLLRAA